MRPADRRVAPRDWVGASRVVAEAYFPHQLKLLSGGQEPRVTLQTLDLGPVLIGQVGWGADVSIECDYPGSYEINMPITGHLESAGQHGLLTSVAGQATVFRPDTPSLITHWDATCTVVGVKFDSAWLDLEVERLVGTDRVFLRGALPDQLNLEHGGGRAWRRLIAGLTTHLRHPDLFAHSVPVQRQLAGAVAAALVEACDFQQSGARASPRGIRRLLEQIHDDPARPWTAADMAEVSGTSVRRMQESFRLAVGCAPTRYLLDVRLQRAHAELGSRPTTTVSDIAADWGFSSASRFAAAYRGRYGVPPSAAR